MGKEVEAKLYRNVEKDGQAFYRGFYILLLLLGSLECSGMNRRAEANTLATLTVTERGASTWHLFFFVGLSVFVLRDSHGRIE